MLFEERQIGILDIFGFEDLGSKNSFEQFCINFANEQLQDFFNTHIFSLEQQEYKSDGIKWLDVSYDSNQDCIKLFIKRPRCLFSLIDEESSLATGNNKNLLDKFDDLGQSKLPQSRCYLWRPEKSDRNSFGIKHYAGVVTYTISEFREKNLEKTNDLLKFMRYNTKFFFIKDLCCQSPLGITGWKMLRNFWLANMALLKLARHKPKADEDSVRTTRAKTLSHAKFLIHSRSDSFDVNYLVAESSNPLHPERLSQQPYPGSIDRLL